MKRKIALRHQFPENYDTNEASDDSGLDTGSEGGAQQNFKDECDINVLLKKFGIGYEMPASIRIPQSGDFTGISDFHSAMNAVNQARETFEELPAHIRAEFKNDPGEFTEFAMDEKNREKLKEWGMLSPEALERDRIAAERKSLSEATPPPIITKKPNTEPSKAS